MKDISKKKDRRLEILQAAQRCLAQYGYAKMTMEDVGKSVGLNKASLYYYYPNKEALVAEVISREARDYIEALHDKGEGVAGCRNRITKYLVERFRIYEQVINLHNMSMQDLRQVGPTLMKVYKECKALEIDFIRSILDACVAQGEIKACDTERIAHSINAIADGYKNLVISNPEISPDAPIDYSSIEQDVVFTVTLMLDGLR